jgi:excisionase family DNA binding protein
VKEMRRDRPQEAGSSVPVGPEGGAFAPSFGIGQTTGYRLQVTGYRLQGTGCYRGTDGTAYYMYASPLEAAIVKAAPSPALLTVQEVAAVLRKRPAAVRALARRGELAFIRSGKAMLVRPEDLAAYLDRCRRPALWERGEKALREALR